MSVSRNDKNRVELVGEVAGEPLSRTFESGSTLLRFSVRVRHAETDGTSVTDNVPVAWWDPGAAAEELGAGIRVKVTGRVRRRFWTGSAGLRSSVEIVAHGVEI